MSVIASKQKKLLLNRLGEVYHLRTDQDLTDVVGLLKSGAPFDQVQEAIEKKVALAARIISIANNKFHQEAGKIENLLGAISLLGDREVYNIADSLNRTSKNFAFKTKSFNSRLTITHSRLSAEIARLICKSIFVDDLYIAALVSNLGVCTIAELYPESFDSISEDNFPVPEKEVFGINRWEISSALLEQWNFSKRICQAVLHLNDPKQAGDFVLEATILNKASSLAARALKIEEACWYLFLPVSEEVIIIPSAPTFSKVKSFTTFDDIVTEALKKIIDD
jgi:HD-like signal output (HDOD) protein